MELKDINECTLVKLREGGLSCLLEKFNDSTVYSLNNFTSDIEVMGGKTNKDRYYDNLKSSSGESYDIIAVKQFDSQISVIKHILTQTEPTSWDWKENSKKDEVQALINKLTEQLEQAKCELQKL